MLGLVNKCCHKLQLNYIILAAKWYIYRTKYLEQNCFLMDFLAELKNKLITEEFILRKKFKYNLYLEHWFELAEQL